jgi:hypothetical protein
MRQRSFAVATKSSSDVASGSVESQYFVGSFSPSGHSARNHSSARGSLRRKSSWAGRTRTAAKREASGPAVPSRQVTAFHAPAGRPAASSFAARGRCSGSRRSRLGGRPRPDRGAAGSGPMPGGHKVVVPRMLAT